MRRVLFVQSNGFRNAIQDIASKQLSKTTLTTTAQWQWSPLPLQTAKRFQSGSNGPQTTSLSPLRTNAQQTPSSILRKSQIGLSSPWKPAIAQLRPFSSTSHIREAPKDTDRQDVLEKEKARREEEEEDARDDDGFQRSEKASKAAQVNLSARLSSPKQQGNTAGFGEIWRLIKIARCVSLSCQFGEEAMLTFSKDLRQNGSVWHSHSCSYLLPSRCRFHSPLERS